MDCSFKVFIEFVTTLPLLFYGLLFGQEAHGFLAPNQTCTPCIGRRSPNHWTTREVPSKVFLIKYIHCFFGHNAIAHLIGHSIV